MQALAHAETATPGALASAVLAVLGTGPAAGDAIERALAARQALIDGYDQLLNIVAALRPTVERSFEERLGSGLVDPALGLILVELDLLGAVEARINRFTDRHVAYYFTDILGQTRRPAVRESVLLRFAPGQAALAIEGGATVVARPAGSPEVQRYRLAEGLRVAPVRVADARTLRFHRDPLISPQSEMGFVTGVSLATLRLDGAGGCQRLFAAAAQTDVEIGLAIASPMLALAEGRRRIEVRLTLGRRQEVAAAQTGRPDPQAAGAGGGEDLAAAVAGVLIADPALSAAFDLGRPEAALPVVAGWVERLVAETGPAPARALVQHACLRAAVTPAQVQAIYGRIATATLVEGSPWPDGGFRETLLAQVAAHLGGAAAAAVAAGLLARPREEAFQVLLQDAFTLSLSSETGPYRIEVVRVTPNPVDAGPGLTFALHLDEAAPAIVAPPGAAAPELTIRMASQSRFCPLSLFEPFALEGIEIAVQVGGLSRVAAFSDDGPLNTAQPFMPFGARPKDGASFLLGARELAAQAGDPGRGDAGLGGPAAQRRRLRGTLPRLWRRLPAAGAAAGAVLPHRRGLEGAERRRGADGAPRRARRAAAAALALRGGGAGPAGRRRAPARRRPISASGTRSGRAWSGWCWTVRAKPSGTAPIPGRWPGRCARPSARGRGRGRSRRRPRRRRSPRSPSTTARGPRSRWTRRRRPSRASASSRSGRSAGRKSFRPHPAGRGAVSGAAGGRHALRPDRRPRGDRAGVAAVRDGGGQPPAHRLPARGRGLALPDRHRLAAAAELEPGLGFDRRADALGRGRHRRARRGRGAAAPPGCRAAGSGWRPRPTGTCRRFRAWPRSPPTAPAPSGSTPRARAATAAARNWALEPPRPGLGSIVQVGPPLGGAPAETEAAFRARVSERLRHRQRLVTAWDAERLVLDAFAQVSKAKCFPALDLDGRAVAPGRADGRGGARRTRGRAAAARAGGDARRADAAPDRGLSRRAQQRLRAGPGPQPQLRAAAAPGQGRLRRRSATTARCCGG